MKNDSRSNVFNWHTALCLGVSTALFTAPVNADVGLPPPAQHQNAGFPSEQALKQRGYDHKTGVWRVESQNQGKPTVTKSGDTITGSQSKNVTVTGNYGEKATIQTQHVQNLNVGKLETVAGGTLAGLTALGGAVGSDYAAETYSHVNRGEWAHAARSAVGAVLEGLTKLDITGLGGGINNFLNKTGIRSNSSSSELNSAIAKAKTAQSQAERNGDYAGALAQAAAAKAAGAAAEAMKQQEQAKRSYDEAKQKGLIKYQLVVNVGGNIKNYPFYATYGGLNIGGSVFNDNNRAHYFHDYQSKVRVNLTEYSTPQYIDIPTPSDKFVRVSWKSYKEGETGYKETNTTNMTAEDFALNQKEMLNILQKMLQNNQTNHAELMNQLSKMGDAVEKSTTSNGFTPTSADSAPYTPQGSSTPQQTRFTMNPDGTVSTSIILRPDLKPNSTLAPTKSEIVSTPNNPNSTGQTGQENQNQERKDGCRNNLNDPQCTDSGDYSWEDVKLPEQTIDLEFKPIDVFNSNGVCPQPKAVDLGVFGQVEFSYQPFCDFASKLRPVLIMMTILICAWFVYGALEEL